MIFCPVNSGTQAELLIDNSLECNDLESPHHLKQMDEGTWRGEVSSTHMCLELGQLRSALLPACVWITKEKKMGTQSAPITACDKEFRRRQFPVRHTLTQNTYHVRQQRIATYRTNSVSMFAKKYFHTCFAECSNTKVNVG